MPHTRPIDRKLGTLADIIGSADFTDSSPLPLDSTNVQDHLKIAHEQACTDLKVVARTLAAQSAQGQELAEKIMTSLMTLKLLGDMYFEKRESENDRRAKPRKD